MEDRERIAEFIENKLRDVWCCGGVNRGVDVTEVAEEILIEAGYTHQPEPPVDRVEAVTKKLWLFHINRARLSDPMIPEFTEDDFRKQKLIDHDSFVREAREILKLCQPELEGIVESLYNEVICPMCYRLNPQHETADNGKGCHWCQEKEDWCGGNLN